MSWDKGIEAAAGELDNGVQPGPFAWRVNEAGRIVSAFLGEQPTIQWCKTHESIKEAPSYLGCRRGLSHIWPAGSPPCVIVVCRLVEEKT